MDILDHKSNPNACNIDKFPYFTGGQHLQDSKRLRRLVLIPLKSRAEPAHFHNRRNVWHQTKV